MWTLLLGNSWLWGRVCEEIWKDLRVGPQNFFGWCKQVTLQCDEYFVVVWITAACSWVVNHRSLSETLKLYDRSWSKTLTSSATEQWVSHYVITLPCTPLNDVIVTFQTLSFTTKGGIMALALTNLRDGHWRHVRNALSPTFSGQKLKLVCLAQLQYLDDGAF